MKPCTRCGQVKSLDDFYARDSKGGHDSWCKRCRIAATAEAYRRNPTPSRRYRNARSRALQILARRHPDELRRLIAEVREREGAA